MSRLCHWLVICAMLCSVALGLLATTTAQAQVKVPTISMDLKETDDQIGRAHV